jgi:hypothetical protein
MTISSPVQRPQKPAKPSPGFRFAHSKGYWAAKRDGKTIYFGRWDDPEVALEAHDALVRGASNGRRFGGRPPASVKAPRVPKNFPLRPHANGNGISSSGKGFTTSGHSPTPKQLWLGTTPSGQTCKPGGNSPQPRDKRRPSQAAEKPVNNWSLSALVAPSMRPLEAPTGLSLRWATQGAKRHCDTQPPFKLSGLPATAQRSIIRLTTRQETRRCMR